MKATILIDDESLNANLKPEHGLSIFIEDNNVKILFDTGESGLFLKNAELLGINLRKIDYLVLSHGHHDHTKGIKSLINFYKENNIFIFPKLVCHPDAFCKRVSGARNIDSGITQKEIEAIFPTEFTHKPFRLNNKFVFLGEVPRTAYPDGENCLGKIEREHGVFCEDKILDDSALVYKTERGLIILVGCAHSGICNIIDYAKSICHDDRIVDIIGGFHLLNSNEKQLNNVKKYIENINPLALHACHCTGKNKSELLHQTNIGVGFVLDF